MVPARPTAVLALRALLFAALLVATACSGSDDAQPGSSVPARSLIVDSTARDTAPRPAPATSEPSSTFDTVPDEPVPGLDSDDPFCRAWSEFAGSFQVLALASNAGADPANAIRLEVAAAGAVVGAASDLDASLPADVDDERDAFLGGLLGPFANRAGMASAALIAAGLTEEQVDELGDLWLATVVGMGSQNPDLALVVPSGYQPAFDDAVATFSANVVPISDDPSLVTDAAAPQTISYIAATCPDQAVLAGNDSIDG